MMRSAIFAPTPGIVTANSPKKGFRIKVETPTTCQALLEFAGGAQLTFVATWDVWKYVVLPQIRERWGDKALKAKLVAARMHAHSEKAPARAVAPRKNKKKRGE